MSIFNKADDLSRRQFVERIAATTLGLSLVPNIAFGAKEAQKQLSKGTAEHVIYLYMSGGMSHVDTFDVKPENPEIQGPVKALKTSADGVQVSEFLPMMAKQMQNEQKLHFI